MKPATRFSLPEPIRQKLADLRSLISRTIACQGIVVLASWLLIAFWVFGLLDYLPARFGADESPRVVRIIMLAILVTGVLAILYHYFWNRWLVRWSDSTLALAIEKQHPEFKSTLVTTVQAASPTRGNLGEDGDWVEHPVRPGMIELASRLALEQIQSIDVRSLIRFRTLQWELAIFGCTAALSCVLLLFAPGWASHWSNRFFGLADVPWPRTTSLGLVGLEIEVPPFTNQSSRERYTVQFEQTVARVPKGVSARLKAWARDLTAAPYDVCTLQYRDREGNRGRASMLSTSDANPRDFVLDGPPLESINDSLWLTLTGGDARISNLFLEAVEPALAVSTEIDVEYPKYLQRSTKTAWGNERLPYRNGMRLPQGSELGFFIRANKPIARCDVMLLQSGDTAENPRREFTVTLDQPAMEFRIPIGKIDNNILVEIRPWDHLGLSATRVQQFVIASLQDNPPSVDFTLEGIGTSITENALLPIRSKIKDDYEVDRVWLESVIDEQPVQASDIAITAQGDGSKEYDLKAMRERGEATPQVGSIFSLMVAASDFLDFQSNPHVGRSSPIQLSVVTVDQLLILLDRREAAMRARVEQIISELGQLRDMFVLMRKTNIPEAPTDESSEGTGAAPSNPDGPSNPTVLASQETGAEQAEDGIAKRTRLLVLRAQQASSQATKSEGELKGVQSEITQILAELINNRIDSQDRRERLEAKVKQPLAELLNNRWTPFAENVRLLEIAASKEAPASIAGKIEQAIAQNNEIIAALNGILSDMIEIQDLTALIDQVRGLLDSEGKVLERAKEEQKKRVLDLLK
jgi:hypothetical protein